MALTFRTLPSGNNQFGNTLVTATVGGLSDTNTFKLFFTATAMNHPDPGAGQWPNWINYWTKALSASPLYYNAGVDYGKIGGSAGSFIVIIGANAYVTDDSLPRHSGVKWIDAFGYIVSHERQGHLPWVQHNWSVHGVDMVNGGTLPVAVDVDRDGVCDREPGDPHPPSWHGGDWEAANGLDPAKRQTHTGTDDDEWIAQQHESNPNAGSLDWAFRGSQWPQ